MKITVDVDVTPQELREFLGLPNVEKIQKEFLKNAEKYLKESESGQYGDIIAAAVQPMMAYQQWLQRMMTGSGTSSGSASRSNPSKAEKKTDE